MPVRTGSDIDELVEGRTVSGEFARTVAEHPDAVALRWREGDGWAQWTYAEYAERAARAAAGLAEIGVEPGSRVTLMMRNRPEFHVLDMAVLLCGATPISIYNSSSVEQIAYLINHCGASVALVEAGLFLDKVRAAQAELPGLHHIVAVGASGDLPEGLVGFDELLATEPVDLEQAAATAVPDDLATVIYTSGTTGPPKGVMITHRNVCWTCASLERCFPPIDTTVGKRAVSYLPMAHIAERVVSHYLSIINAFEVITCPEPGAIADYTRNVHPHVLFGVPRVFEKIYAGVNAVLAADPEQAAKFDEAVEAARPLADKRAWGNATEEEEATWRFLDEVAFSKVRSLLGLDELVMMITGAAPMRAELLSWFRAVGMPLSEIYGMSESTGPISWASERVKPGTVGPAIPGSELMLGDDGELLFRGGNAFAGYLGDPEKTAETIDSDGWVHTGDIAEIDDDGYVRIIDRKKELIVTAGGKNISPANLEAAIRMIPIVGQAFAVGDERPFVGALVTLDPETAPAWAETKGIEQTSLRELAAHPELLAELDRMLDEAMEPFNHAERVKKIVVLGEEWLPDSDVLTPTQKLKRRAVRAKYTVEIESIYE